eukprot:Gb_11644 [translate_table: standard]
MARKRPRIRGEQDIMVDDEEEEGEGEEEEIVTTDDDLFEEEDVLEDVAFFRGKSTQLVGSSCNEFLDDVGLITKILASVVEMPMQTTVLPVGASSSLRASTSLAGKQTSPNFQHITSLACIVANMAFGLVGWRSCEVPTGGSFGGASTETDYFLLGWEAEMLKFEDICNIREIARDVLNVSIVKMEKSSTGGGKVKQGKVIEAARWMLQDAKQLVMTTPSLGVSSVERHNSAGGALGTQVEEDTSCTHPSLTFHRPIIMRALQQKSQWLYLSISYKTYNCLKHTRSFKTKEEWKKLRPMILERIKQRARDYPVMSMVPIAHEVLKARAVLLEGVSKLLKIIPVKACRSGYTLPFSM